MKQSIAGLPEEDLIAACIDVDKVREFYAEREILIYGATGFIGTWLTASLLYSNQILGLNSKIKILTRNAQLAKEKFGRELLSNDIYQHDLSSSEPKIEITADLIFHGATPSRSSTGSEDGNALVNSTLNAARHAASVKSRNVDRPHVVHLNSGAIYGKQITQMRSESDLPTTLGSNPYVEAKLGADQILSKAKLKGLIHFQSPRLFAFGGPLLPLDEHFAIGNFLSNGLQHQKIEVKGNPGTTRSYMYPADLAKVLLLLPSFQTNDSINIGSEASITMIELAELVSNLTSRKGIYLSNPKMELNYYVPSTTNLNRLVGGSKVTPIEILLEKWIKWLEVESV
jgi:nucleoside-diphosphate-sugar epimerase